MQYFFYKELILLSLTTFSIKETFKFIIFTELSDFVSNKLMFLCLNLIKLDIVLQLNSN